MGHNIPLAALGVFILWLGWFGFNPGSTTTADTSIAMIFVNTNLAAAAGACLAMIVSWMKFGKPEVGMSLNGALAGLVGITAGCANVSPSSAIIIGAAAGVIVVFSVMFFDKIRIDDPVGAFSVHGICGAWGLLATGLFATSGSPVDGSIEGLFYGGGIEQLWYQFVGVIAIGAFVAVTAGALFATMKAAGILRVSAEDEIEGLDIAEHGSPGYATDVVTAPVSV